MIALPKGKLGIDTLNNKKNTPGQYGRFKNARNLITNRKKIGFADNTVGFSPEEVIKNVEMPDFSLIHPDSIEAKLQKYVVFEYPSRKSLNAAKSILSKKPEILDVSENKKGRFSVSPNGPLYPPAAGNPPNNTFQWGLFQLNMEDAWTLSTGHAYLGIPDSGLDIANTNFTPAQHPDLLNFRPQFSWDHASNDANVYAGGRGSGHGTHVTGIISASSANGLGTSGVCWNCSIAFARTDLQLATVAANYQHFADTGVQAVNSSFGLALDNLDCITQTNVVCDAIQLLSDREIIVAASAGNGTNHQNLTVSLGQAGIIEFPASEPRVIAVGVTGFNGLRAQFSDFGPQLDIVAPGVDVLSTFARGVEWNDVSSCGDNFGPGTDQDGYGLCTGTSMAAPHITGLLGIMRSVDPLLDSDNIKPHCTVLGSFFLSGTMNVGMVFPMLIALFPMSWE